MNCSISSLYVCVKNMERAIKFYENFFEMKVSEKDEIYSVFQINKFRFGLFAYEKMHEEHIFGSNCLPSIEVESVDILQDKIEGLNIVFPLTVIGGNYVVEIEDSEGNHIEITAPKSKSKFNNITLETKRAILKPLTIKELIEISNNECNYIEKDLLTASTRNAIAKKILKMKNVEKKLHIWYTYWLIIYKDTGKGIGFIGYKGELDENLFVEVGYNISSEYRNRGIMTEALKTITKWTSSMKYCKGVRAVALKSNEASNRVLCKSNFYLKQCDNYFNFYVFDFNRTHYKNT